MAPCTEAVCSPQARGSNPNSGPLLHVMPPLSPVDKEFCLQPVAEFWLKLLKMLTITTKMPPMLPPTTTSLAGFYLLEDGKGV